MGGNSPLSYSRQEGFLGQRDHTGPGDSPPATEDTCGLGGALCPHLCQPTPTFLAIFKERPEESPTPAPLRETARKGA